MPAIRGRQRKRRKIDKRKTDTRRYVRCQVETEQDPKVEEREPAAVPVTAKDMMNRGTSNRARAGVWEEGWVAASVVAVAGDPAGEEVGDSDSGTEVKSHDNYQ